MLFRSSKALRVAAWLNSTWLRAAARLSAPPAANGFARFGAHVVAELPLPDSVLSDEKLEALAVAGARGCAVQFELDALTLRHLGLDAHAAAALASVDRRAGAHR